MAKDRKIIVEFDKDLVGDVEYFEPIEYECAETKFPVNSAKAFGSSQYSSSYAYAYAFDGSTSSAWRAGSTTMPQYIGMDFEVPVAIYKVSVYLLSYYPNQYTVQASNDNLTYVDICSGSFVNSTNGTQSIITNTSAKYQYWRLNITSIYSSVLSIPEISFYEAVKRVNAKAFTVKSKEYDYVPEGKLVDRTYKVRSVEKLKYKEIVNLNDAQMTGIVCANQVLSLNGG